MLSQRNLQSWKVEDQFLLRFGPHACLLYCDTQDQNDFSSTIGSLQQFESCHHVSLLILTQISLLVPWLFLVVGEWKVLILNLEGHMLYLFSLHFLLPFFCMAMWQNYLFIYLFFKFASRLLVSSLFLPYSRQVIIIFFSQENCCDNGQGSYFFIIFLHC